MINNFFVGFAACAVLMTLVPSAGTKINQAVSSTLSWISEVYAEFKAARAADKDETP